MSSLFRKSLLDLVKGLRSHKDDESAFINQCLSEIKEEVKQNDHDIKAQAILKLSYLYMLGYDISFSHFHIVEVMSQPSFQHRRIAYLAASLSFTEDTDVILLTTHLFKKSFKNRSSGGDARMQEGLIYETGTASNCLANICTSSLAETLLEDAYGMMNSSKPYIRKKAVLVLYSIFKKFPRALPLSFNRLKEKLKDEDPGVQNAAVNVICELARKNPKNYLGILPQLCDLLNNSNNNWMLIKLVKLLGSLIPAEPRLGRKLHEPLTHIIQNTPAKSLLYECINTATNCEVMSKSMVRLCLDKLRTFVEDPDQNLKYLGLLGLNKIMRQSVKQVAQHRDLILACLDDPDQTIRMRALDLITSMVNERNLEAIIRRLTDHLYGTDGNYREHVLEQMISVCKKGDYEYVRDFAWYVELLTNMTGLSSMGKRNAELISSQLKDVTIRVPEVREFSVEQMEGIIVNNGLIGDSHNMQSNSICRILLAAAYIVGEFSKFVKQHLTLVCAMLQSRIASLEGDIQCVFIHNALKVVCAGLQKYMEDCENGEEDDDDDDDDNSDNDNVSGSDNENSDTNKKSSKIKPKTELERKSHTFNKCLDLLDGSIRLLEPLSHSNFIEVQERATSYLHFLKWLKQIFSNNKNENNDSINENNENKESIENETNLLDENLSNGSNINNLNNIMTSEMWNEALDIIDSFATVFGSELMPVHPQSQEVISKKIPKGLNLDEWIGEQWPETSGDEDDSDEIIYFDDKDDDWFPEYTKQELSKKQQQQVREQKAQRKQRQKGAFYIPNDSDNEFDENDNENDKDSNKRKKRKKKDKDRKLTEEDILNAPAKVQSEKLGLTVHPRRRNRGSKKKQQFTVLRGVESVAGVGKVAKKPKRNDDLLAADVDFDAPNLDSIPTVQAYTQERQTAGQIIDDNQEQTQSKENQKGKKNKKKKGKKGKKDKKKGKKSKDTLEDEKQLSDYEPDNKKSKKKGKKGKNKKSKKNKVEQTTQEPAEGNLLGLLGFGDDQPTTSTKSEQKQQSDNDNNNNEQQTSSNQIDSILGLFGDETEEPPQPSQNGTTHDHENNEQKTEKSSKKHKSSKRKNGVINNDTPLPSLSTHVLHSDDNISIIYHVRPSNKKSGLNVNFTTKNISDHTIKSVKLHVSKSSNLKVSSKKDDSSTIYLCKNLENNEEHSQKLGLKCKDYSSKEILKCKLIYSFEDKSQQSQKIDNLNLTFGTWAFVMSSQNTFTSEQELMDFLENDCPHKSTQKIKLPQSRSIGEALDTLVKVWRVEIVDSSEKKATYYGKLLLDRHIGIYVKTSKSKNALQVSVMSSEENFGETMLEEIKNVLVS